MFIFLKSFSISKDNKCIVWEYLEYKILFINIQVIIKGEVIP